MRVKPGATMTERAAAACLLHVNIDHIATVRNARGAAYPDPVAGAALCLNAGADGITAHLREDRRHIRDADVFALAALLRGLPQGFNFEMAATAEMVQIACKARPAYVTLVPERREERTTEGGLDVLAGGERLRGMVAELKAADIQVSLFVTPDAEQLRAAAAAGAQQVELHTGEYAHASAADAARELASLQAGATLAKQLGMRVAAGRAGTHAHCGGR
jgi:pyridoxine 5-phosphate synthase